MGKGYELRDCFLFAVASPADLARRLLTTVPALESLSKDEGNFRLYTLKSGRAVQEPKPDLQRIHTRIHELLSRVTTPDYLHSKKGRSYITNARAHQFPGPTIKLDIKAFFRSVPRSAIFRFFNQRMECARDVSGLLANLLTIEGHLATGSSASPVVSYYAYKEMFDELEELARTYGLIMTCYVDDITMTGPRASERVLREARLIVKRYGLRSHKAICLKRPSPKVITGVAVSAEGAKLPHERQQKIRAGYAAFQSSTSRADAIKVLVPLISRVSEAAQIDPAAWESKALDLQREKSALDIKARLDNN